MIVRFTYDVRYVSNLGKRNAIQKTVYVRNATLKISFVQGSLVNLLQNVLLFKLCLYNIRLQVLAYLNRSALYVLPFKVQWLIYVLPVTLKITCILHADCVCMFHLMLRTKQLFPQTVLQGDHNFRYTCTQTRRIRDTEN